jgi:hypothetical protein
MGSEANQPARGGRADGVSERTFRHWTRRFEEEGEAGLVDRRLGKPSPRRVPAAEAEQVAELYRTRYGGFTAKHFHERLVGGARLQLGLHLDQDVSAVRSRSSGTGAAARGAPSQAAALAVARHDAILACHGVKPIAISFHWAPRRTEGSRRALVAAYAGALARRRPRHGNEVAD